MEENSSTNPGEVSGHEDLDPVEALRRAWPELSQEERRREFRELNRLEAEEFFLQLGSFEQAELIEKLGARERRSWIRLLAMDDVADVIQEFPEEERPQLVELLDHQMQREVTALLRYEEDAAGGLMNSRYVRLRPEMTVDEAIRYLRVQTQTQVETIYVTFVLDVKQNLLGVISLRDLLMARSGQTVGEIMNTDVVTVPEDMDQEKVADLFRRYELNALPVVTADGKMRGIVTWDDIVDVIEEEATEDLQKISGAGVTQDPYLQVGFLELIRKRAGWLIILFVFQMATATVIGLFETQLEKALILTLFIPLIISSGGNMGSQAATLIVRAISLKQLTTRSWWRVLLKESSAGLVIGATLGVLGWLRVWLVPEGGPDYAGYYGLIGISIGISVMAVMLWGSIVGSMLPLILSKLRVDPATASTPLVATVMDITGLLIYFFVAATVLGGTLL